MAYDNNPKKELTLRDELAIERTRLAEERTYLAYIRTGMSLLLPGLFFLGYFMEGPFHYAGYATIAIGLAFIAYGTYNHRKSIGLIDRMTLGIFGLGKSDKGKD
jgi:putative membrane protein